MKITNDVIKFLRSKDKALYFSAELSGTREEFQVSNNLAREALRARAKPSELINAMSSLLDAALDLYDRYSLHPDSKPLSLETRIELKAQREFFAEQWDIGEEFDDRAEQNRATQADEFNHFEEIDSRISNLGFQFAELDQKVTDAITYIDSQAEPLQARYKKANDYFDSMEPALKERFSRLDGLLGLAGEKVLAGSYDKQAEAERWSANWLRSAALVMMVIALTPVLRTIFEHHEESFDVAQSLMRLGYSLLLSVPAAYLARESSKHRQQQYSFKQTALDVGAIGSYINPLPDEAKHRITESIAEKLFAPKSFDHVTKESYPVNTQELLLKLIDAAVEKKEKAKAKGKSSDD